MKASRYLTHMKRLREIADAVARFWEPLEPLRHRRRLGPVLWQLPENFHRDDDLLTSALDELPPARHCFEFRHSSWFANPVRRLLEERGASLAIGDDKRRPLPDARPTGAIAYLRLHYGHRGRDGNYSEAELDDWRRRIAAWRSRRPVFVYLNNDWKGYAPTNARYLKRGVYLTNAVMHFKWRARGKRRLHQTPRAGEVEACKPWLEAELKAVRPTGLLALGATAAKALFGSSVRVASLVDDLRLIASTAAKSN